jgi:hypothetical protein
MLRFTSLFFILLAHCGAAQQEGHSKTAENCLRIHHAYLDHAYTLTKNCVGFNAPVSGRAYGYFSLGMYESAIGMPGIPYASLEEKLNGYKRISMDIKHASIHWEVLANTTDYLLLKHFYRNAPPTYLNQLDDTHDSIARTLKTVKRRSINQTEKFAKALAISIIQWSEKDGAEIQIQKVYDYDKQQKKCDSCWSRTFPGYLPPMLPEWGNVRTMLPNSRLVTDTMPIFPFGTDSSSFMYNEARMVWENGHENNDEFEVIAEYWDDGSGRSGTPTGHYFSIAKQLAIEKDLKLPEALLLYARLGTAINDAFIASFHLKYQFFFIRPITYIHKYIDPHFNTRISTPPFPEYPSGHSFQAGAASEVMKSIFGDEINFHDHTHENRTDIDGQARFYTTLTEMSEEISISRFYGGIHFKETLDRSLLYGRKIGTFVTQNIQP